MRLILIWFLLVALVQAKPLPDPLSLEQALTESQAHPLLQLARAEVQSAQAILDNAQAQNGLEVSLVGSLRYQEPSEISVFREQNDSRIGLLVTKTLYDFGYTKAGETAAKSKLQGRLWLEKDVRQNRHLKVTQAFYDVILADLKYSRDNEAMAIAYVRLERVRDEHGLGKLSDIELLQQQSRYQSVLQKRAVSASRQQATRYQLASAMNRPMDLPNDLIRPGLDTRTLPAADLHELLLEVQQHNPQIKWLQAALLSSIQSAKQADARYAPTLRGEMEATEYYRETRSTSPFSAALVLEIPLYTGGRADAKVATALAAVEEKRALLQQSQLEKRQRTTELWLELQTLQAHFQELDVLEAYRDLNLDLSRSRYDMEITSDLGDAMVQTSEVILQKARAEFKWMLVIAQLNALRGSLLTEGVIE